MPSNLNERQMTTGLHSINITLTGNYAGAWQGVHPHFSFVRVFYCVHCKLTTVHPCTPLINNISIFYIKKCTLYTFLYSEKKYYKLILFFKKSVHFTLLCIKCLIINAYEVYTHCKPTVNPLYTFNYEARLY